MKLAAAPSGPVTITITPPTGFITNKTSLVFNALHFSANQTVTVTTTAPAGTPGAIQLFSPDVGPFDQVSRYWKWSPEAGGEAPAQPRPSG